MYTPYTVENKQRCIKYQIDKLW